MEKILSGVRKFFFGVRLLLPLTPIFVWIAARRLVESIIAYWTGSQAVVDGIAVDYRNQALNKSPSEYDTFLYWAYYCIASFLYLVGWIVQSWLTVKALHLLMATVF